MSTKPTYTPAAPALMPVRVALGDVINHNPIFNSLPLILVDSTPRAFLRVPARGRSTWLEKKIVNVDLALYVWTVGTNTEPVRLGKEDGSVLKDALMRSLVCPERKAGFEVKRKGVVRGLCCGVSPPGDVVKEVEDDMSRWVAPPR